MPISSVAGCTGASLGLSFEVLFLVGEADVRTSTLWRLSLA